MNFGVVGLIRSASRSRSHSRDRQRHNRQVDHSLRDRDQDRNRSRGNDRRKETRSGSRSPARDDNRLRNRRSRSRSPQVSRDRDRDRDRERDRRGGRDWERDRARAKQRDLERDADRQKYAGLTGNQIERLRAKERASNSLSSSTLNSNFGVDVSIPNAPLSDDDYEKFTFILQSLTVARDKIRDAMGFAYDKIESASEVQCGRVANVLFATL